MEVFMYIELRCSNATVSNQQCTRDVTVELENVDPDELFAALTNDIIENNASAVLQVVGLAAAREEFDDDKILDAIGVEYVKKYFDLQEVKDE
jgi:hypothetical protein